MGKAAAWQFSSMTDMITDIAGPDADFFAPALEKGLKRANDGELFLEYRHAEALTLDDGRIRSTSANTSTGFGLRAVSGEATAYAYASEITEGRLEEAAETVRAISIGKESKTNLTKAFTPPPPLYTDADPFAQTALADRVALLNDIDRIARAKDPRVCQVTAGLSGSWQKIRILRLDGRDLIDIRPLVGLSIGVVMQSGDRQESGSAIRGARITMEDLLAGHPVEPLIDEAIRKAEVNLDSVEAPAGEMPVVLGAGWPAVLLHEAVGHGLEGDFNRKGTSAFAGKIGEQVAAKGITVVDDGTLADRRGSLSFDDEGTPTQRTVLIEDGILTGYMQDRLNARLMGAKSTGNGRRQSCSFAPLPRMTNTFMENGGHSQEEMIASIDRGLFAPGFGGGQVDITSGKFVFTTTEAYLIENGKITAPVKGATLIGNGPDALTKVTMIGNDLELDPGMGACGKSGQSLPVGVGQPSLKLSHMTVGGTAHG